MGTLITWATRIEASAAIKAGLCAMPRRNAVNHTSRPLLLDEPQQPLRAEQLVT